MDTDFSQYHDYSSYAEETTTPAAPPKLHTDPLSAAAASMMRLANQPEDGNAALLEVALQVQVERIGQNDFSGLETMLTCQAQMLHGIFAQAVENYASARMEEKTRLYGNLALKSQNCCRMTIAALNVLKNPEVKRKMSKTRNELIRDEFPFNYREADHAAMDSRRTPAPSTFDPWMAALEQSGG